MANVYNRFKKDILDGIVDISADNLDVLLLDSTHVFDQDEDFVSQIVADEITVAGYARQNLTGVVVTEDDVNNRGDAAANQVVFAGMAAGQTVGSAVVFRFNAADAAAELIAFYDVTNTATDVGSITIQFDGLSPGDFLRAL